MLCPFLILIDREFVDFKDISAVLKVTDDARKPCVRILIYNTNLTWFSIHAP